MTWRIPWGHSHHIALHRPWVRREDGPRPLFELRPNANDGGLAPATNQPPRNSVLNNRSVPRGPMLVLDRSLNVQGRRCRISLELTTANRLITLAGPAHSALVRSALAAAITAEAAADPATPGQLGVMDFSFRHGGQLHEASLSFDTDGQVLGLQITTSDLRELVNVAVPASRSTEPVVTEPAQVLVLPAGLQARVDVQGQVQRRTEGANQVYAYTPRNDHGLVVQIEPGGVMNLKLVMADPELRDKLGTGTDMFLGVAKALVADGVAVSRIKAQWLDETGRDSQFRAIAAADQQGRDLAQAAAGIFSGKQARRYGFSEIEVNRIAGGYEATFRRPSLPTWLTALWSHW